MAFTDDFLKKIKGGAYASWKNYKVLPSVVAAQAALESNWGRSALAIQGKNLFGVKGSYKGQSVVFPTLEWTGSGYVTINDAFAKYPSWDVSIVEHGKLIGEGTRYRAAIGKTDPSDQITAIWAAGFASDPSYPSKVMSVINANNLRAWDLDAFSGGDGGGFSGDIDGGNGYKNFSENLIKKNGTTRPGFKLEAMQAIVLHDIQSGSNLGGIRNTLNSGNGGQKMGYHVIVSENDAQLVVPFTEGVYHAERGKSLVAGMSNPNKKTISIGVVTKRSLSNFSTNLNIKLALVIAEICRTYKIPATAVLPAWQVDGVNEPVSWYNNPFLYTAFVGMVSDAIEKGEDVITNPDYNSGGTSGGGTGADGLIPNGEGIIKNIIKEANDLLGTMTYSWTKPAQIRKGGFGDCSSFCQYLYQKHAKVDIGGYTDAQWFGNWGKKINVKDARAGDLIFFTGTYPTYMTTTHIGIVVGGGKMIDFGSTPGPKLNNYNDSIWGPKIYGVKRIFSDAEYNQSQSGGGKPSKPTIDPKGTYVVNVKKPVIATNADVGGVSQRRLSSNEVYRVQEIGKTSLQLTSNELWVPKSSDAITVSRLSTPSSPIGAISTKLPTKVYSAPTYVAEPAMEKGAPKILPEKTSMNIYAVENGFAQVDLEKDHWAVANSTYATLNIDLSEEFVEDINFEQGIPTSTTVRGRYEPEDFITVENSLPIKNGLAVIAHPDLLDIGSVINIEIPSATKYNRKAVVVSNKLNDSDGNVLELIFTNQGDQYNFGGRTGIITLLEVLNNDVDITKFMNNPEGYEQTKAIPPKTPEGGMLGEPK